MITGTMYVLAVTDLTAACNFYCDNLGFQVKEIGDDGWRMFEKDSCRIMAGHCPDANKASELGDHSYFAYLLVDDIDDYYRFVSDNNVELIKTLRDEAWGMREFGIRTNEGHRIMIGQTIS